MGSKRSPGHICQTTNPVDVCDGTNCLAPSPTPGPCNGPDWDSVSFEIGSCFLPVKTRLRGLKPNEIQVLSWLRANKATIVNAERTFRIDRRAIAGAIAWEMLRNPHPHASAIDVGPGKVHLFQFSRSHWIRDAVALAWQSFFGDSGEGTLAKEAEDRGYLAQQSPESRKRLLATDAGAIRYIAAIMAAIADLSENDGFESIRKNPVILTNVYQGKDLKEWEDHLRTLPAGSRFKGGNPMDEWVSIHFSFLEDAVGSPDFD